MLMLSFTACIPLQMVTSAVVKTLKFCSLTVSVPFIQILKMDIKSKSEMLSFVDVAISKN